MQILSQLVILAPLALLLAACGDSQSAQTGNANGTGAVKATGRGGATGAPKPGLGGSATGSGGTTSGLGSVDSANGGTPSQESGGSSGFGGDNLQTSATESGSGGSSGKTRSSRLDSGGGGTQTSLTTGSGGTVAQTSTSQTGTGNPAGSGKCSATATDGAGTFTDARDGQTYRCVVVGTQIWMAQNLNFGTTRVNADADQTAIGQKYCYDDLDAACPLYGGLYQWHSAMGIDAKYMSSAFGTNTSTKYQGICPLGWHLPTREEWSTVRSKATCDYNGETVTTSSTTSYNGTELSTGYCLKSNGKEVLKWAQNPDGDVGGDGSDAYGWTAYPTGGRYPANYSGPSGTLSEPGYTWGPRRESQSDALLTGYRAMWWATTEQSSGVGAVYAHIVDDGWTITVENSSGTKANKVYGLSVRCIQD